MTQWREHRWNDVPAKPPVEIPLRRFPSFANHRGSHWPMTNAKAQQRRILRGVLRNIEPWAKKCADECRKGARVAFLVPASIGSVWFAKHVWGVARVMALRPRMSFDGKNPYPKDMMLCMYGAPPGFELWRWKGVGRA